jgi:hypothetical protein
MLYGTPKKSCLFSVFVVPSFLCIKCPSKIVPRLEMRVVPCCTNCCPFAAVRTVKSVLYGLHKTVVSFSRNLCTEILYDPQEIRTVRTLTLSNTLLDFCATRLSWESCPYSANVVFSSSTLSLLLSQQEDDELPKNGCALLP